MRDRSTGEAHFSGSGGEDGASQFRLNKTGSLERIPSRITSVGTS